MKQRKFSLLAVMLAAIAIFSPRFAWAQPDAGTDGGGVIVVEDDDKAPCPSCDAAVKAAVRQCQADKAKAEGDRDSQKARADTCEALKTKDPPPAVKKAALRCGSGTKQTPKGCVCEVEGDVRIPLFSTGEWVCVPSRKAFADLQMELLRLQGGHAWAADQIEALKRQVGELAQSDKEGLDRLGRESVRLVATVQSLDQRLTTLEQRVDEIEPLARAGSVVEYRGSAEPMFIALPGSGPAFAILATNRLSLRFDKTSKVWVFGEFSAGGVFNEGVGGSAWLLSETGGVKFALDDDMIHNLQIGVRGFQVFSGHGAGYQGVLNDPQLGYYVAGQAGYEADLGDYFSVGARGFVGGGVGNYFEAPGDLRETGGVMGGASLLLSFHTPYNR